MGCGKDEHAEGDDHGGSNHTAADTNKALRVVAHPVAASPFEDWGEFSADLKGADDVTLTAPMAGGGRVKRIAEVGRTVKIGESLCDIDSDKFGAMLAQANSALDMAKGEKERTENNVGKGYLGKAALDKAEFDIQSARVSLLQAQSAYDDARCRAPFSGVIVSRSAEKHQTLSPGAPTLRLASLGKLEAVAALPESEAMDYSEGQEASFRSGSNILTGKIRALDRAVESRNRTMTARVDLENPKGALRPGMVGKVRVLRKRYDSAVVVPSQSVLRLATGTVLMVVREGRARQVPVVLGPAQGESVLVLEGLKPGETVITSGAFQVSDGTKVEF
jgi:membrane fusion protein (multidrug efflux system)